MNPLRPNSTELSTQKVLTHRTHLPPPPPQDLAPAGQLAVHARNPYVSFKLREQSFKSTTGHTLHPKWNKEPQAFHFYTRLDAAELLNEGRCERLTVEVKDKHNLSSNETLGEFGIKSHAARLGHRHGHMVTC